MLILQHVDSTSDRGMLFSALHKATEATRRSCCRLSMGEYGGGRAITPFVSATDMTVPRCQLINDAKLTYQEACQQSALGYFQDQSDLR